MNRRISIAWLGIVALLLAASTLAMAQQNPPTYIDLSPYPDDYGGETIEVPPGEIETLWFHINDSGMQQWYHIDEVSFHWEIDNPDEGGDGLVELLHRQVNPSMQFQASTWYPYGDIQVTGKPSTVFKIQIDLGLGLQPPTGPIWSNAIYKHITPEPSSLLAMGTGVLGIGGLLLRRRR